MGNYCGSDEHTNDGVRPFCNCGKDDADFSPETEEDISNRVCFGAGCYWGTEKFFRRDFGEKMFPESKIKGMVGFMGPSDSPENPSYQDVCTGTTGHVEVYYLEFEGGAEMFEKLVKFFFQFHDPTTLNRQGNDQGSQYASVIFCYDKIQIQIAKKVKRELQAYIEAGILPADTYSGVSVSTAINKCTKFYPAHAAHQDYLLKNPKGYCNHRIRIQKWPVISNSNDADVESTPNSNNLCDYNLYN
eukprot:gene8981-18586_t